jgi:hypothetical protein
MIYHRSLLGILKYAIPVTHRNQDYDEAGFQTLLSMQQQHFWYRGRHQFLLKAPDRFMPVTRSQLSAIDLGGGVGGGAT